MRCSSLSNNLVPVLLLLASQLRLCVSFIPPSSSSAATSKITSNNNPSSSWNPVALHASSSTSSSDESTSSYSSLQSKKRRNLLQTALIAPYLTVTTAITTTPQVASAAASEKPPPIIPLLTTAKRLRTVPLFAIVDGNGTPFHTYDKDSAGGFGYFFTSYISAEYILDDAKKAFEKAKLEAEQKKEAGDTSSGAIGEDGTGEVPDTWGQARIVTVPLDVAMQLSVKKTQSVATNAKARKFNTYYQVIPATEDLNAAMRIDSGQRFKERGRVPLFFVDGLTLPSNEEGLDRVTPAFFILKDLVTEWKKQYPDSDLPKIQVRELNETFRSMITPAGRDKSVKDLVFVANSESVARAKDCARSYKLGEMILTK
eukprot:CAMPEP_0113414790 /NCGR_PEP_ID=MMETSP0013_2-20120614/24213_1 /TAXON_ID=2843 ORGANISM="Skeletonema costatum, Strain 1716" /NCGR_SAMPLE_ID=MMETSP0013_2 /ASSEMBLY_ACC=CAM_ASM_000158 /LENGTH=370 /DNA_ID=CAMNT_0000301687 /DNA_START=126 /DNA_END=1238 /DNA_ORIENTATION=- /assembly_acc=CAM_ASM_000158